MNTIPIYFNGESRAIPDGTTLQQALALLAPGGAPDHSPVATALNGSHVARPRREHVRLAPGDHVTTFTPIVGG
ncbi:Sulfur carrier protein ThiS OS=Castellaniella sp OX=1955812 GN=thiS PE=4 SV=1 [Castellaniella denitrificans]|jgi:thiamine biosynthesis protein ThiS